MGAWGRMRGAAVFLAFVAGLAGSWSAGVASQAAATQTPFASLVARLSEPGGDFGGDNLISNEQSYLHVMTSLEQSRVTGGAYLGVGPDQNFSYIGQIKPAVAFLIDIRRDNLLLLLLFKAIFAQAPTRVEYLCLLTGRAPPAAPETWATATIDRIVTYLDAAAALPDARQTQIRARLEQMLKGFGVPLSAADLATINGRRREFVYSGLSLAFAVRGRPPAPYYPTLRTLLTETDRSGRQVSFLASEPSYQFVRGLQARDLVIPVVGDVSGPHAMTAIAAEMAARQTPLSAFYISNVEQYLFGDGTFPAYVDNLKRMPRDARSTIIRSVFPSGFRGLLPGAVPGSYSASLIQPLNQMLADIAAGRTRSYFDLVLASGK